jgi:hypothetical protein
MSRSANPGLTHGAIAWTVSRPGLLNRSCPFANCLRAPKSLTRKVAFARRLEPAPIARRCSAPDLVQAKYAANAAQVGDHFLARLRELPQRFGFPAI